MVNEMPVSHLLSPMQPIPTTSQSRGRLHLPVACLLCDIYGTLFISDSGEWTAHQKSIQINNDLSRLLKKYTIETLPELFLNRFKKTIADHHTRLIQAGNPHPEVVIEEVWKACLPFNDQEQVQRFAIEFEAITNPVWPMPHLLELLNYCRQSGIVLGIISNAQFYTPKLFQWAFNQDIGELGFNPDLVFFSYQHSIAKPDQMLFTMAGTKLKTLHIEPEQTAYLGNDMRNDMLPAHRAGFQTVLFAGDKRSLRLRREDPQCAAYHPDVTITDLQQLISQLNGQPHH